MIWDQTDKLVREAVRAIPDGDYEASSFLDDDGRVMNKTIPIKIKVEVRGDELTIDYSEVSDQVPGFINCGSSGGMAAARVAFKALTSPQREVNEGSFRALKVILPPGKLLSARRPAPIGGWSLSLPTVLDTILRALAPALPQRIPAAHKGDMGGYAIFGANPKTGRRYVCQNIIGGGWGGRPFEDGASASVSMCQGDVKNTPIELQELYYPLLYECHRFRPDSGGAGKYRGGVGVEVKVTPLLRAARKPQHRSPAMPALGTSRGRRRGDQPNIHRAQRQKRDAAGKVQPYAGAAWGDSDVFDGWWRGIWTTGKKGCRRGLARCGIRLCFRGKSPSLLSRGVIAPDLKPRSGINQGSNRSSSSKRLERLELFERLFNVRVIQDNALLRRRIGRFFLARYYNRGMGQNFRVPVSGFAAIHDVSTKSRGRSTAASRLRSVSRTFTRPLAVGGSRIIPKRPLKGPSVMRTSWPRLKFDSAGIIPSESDRDCRKLQYFVINGSGIPVKSHDSIDTW